MAVGVLNQVFRKFANQIGLIWAFCLLFALLHMVWGISHMHESLSTVEDGHHTLILRLKDQKAKKFDDEVVIGFMPAAQTESATEVAIIAATEAIDIKTLKEKQEYPRSTKRAPTYDVLAAMPTLARVNDPDYLVSALSSIFEEVSIAYSEAKREGITPWRIHVLVFKPNAERHIRFEQVMALWTNRANESLAVGLSWSFVDRGSSRFYDPYPNRPEPDHRNNPQAIPGHTARQQNCDMVSLLDYAIANFEFKYFLFLEDDFIVCKHGFSKTQTAVLRAADKKPLLQTNKIEKALELFATESYTELKDYIQQEAFDALQPILNLPLKQRLLAVPIALEQMTFPFGLVKVSYGMNGLVYHSRDLIEFASHVREYLDKLPVDLLVDDYFFPPPDSWRHYMKSRPALRVPHVLMAHIGQVSTFSERNQQGFRPAFPGCDQYVGASGNFKLHKLA